MRHDVYATSDSGEESMLDACFAQNVCVQGCHERAGAADDDVEAHAAGTAESLTVWW